MTTFTPDEETRVPCERCKGNGRRSEQVVTSARHTGYAIVTERHECWLCEGIGSCTGTRLRWWRAAGSPVNDPDPKQDSESERPPPDSGDDKIMLEDWVREESKKARGDGD
jgi:hypothetical protein